MKTPSPRNRHLSGERCTPADLACGPCELFAAVLGRIQRIVGQMLVLRGNRQGSFFWGVRGQIGPLERSDWRETLREALALLESSASSGYDGGLTSERWKTSGEASDVARQLGLRMYPASDWDDDVISLRVETGKRGSSHEQIACVLTDDGVLRRVRSQGDHANDNFHRPGCLKIPPHPGEIRPSETFSSLAR